MFENMGMGELLIIMFVVLILFGGKKIPEIAKNLGKGINEFKRGLNDIKKDITITDDDFKNQETKKINWQAELFSFYFCIIFISYLILQNTLLYVIYSEKRWLSDLYPEYNLSFKSFTKFVLNSKGS